MSKTSWNAGNLLEAFKGGGRCRVGTIAGAVTGLVAAGSLVGMDDPGRATHKRLREVPLGEMTEEQLQPRIEPA